MTKKLDFLGCKKRRLKLMKMFYKEKNAILYMYLKIQIFKLKKFLF
jgi:hypothetical protein